MSTNDGMNTYRQYLSARELADTLLMKYSAEACNGTKQLYSDDSIQDALLEVAGRLGFRVERIAAPVLEAAE